MQLRTYIKCLEYDLFLYFLSVVMIPYQTRGGGGNGDWNFFFLV